MYIGRYKNNICVWLYGVNYLETLDEMDDTLSISKFELDDEDIIHTIDFGVKYSTKSPNGKDPDEPLFDLSLLSDEMLIKIFKDEIIKDTPSQYNFTFPEEIEEGVIIDNYTIDETD